MNLQIGKAQVLIYGVPMVIILSSVLLTLSPLLDSNPDVAMGITFDLTLTAPLVYLVLIRKKKVPLISVLPLFILGIVLATLLLPHHQQYHLNLVTSYLLPVVELAVFFVIAYHTYKTVKSFREDTNCSHDFYLILKESAVKSIGYPKVAKMLASEIAMFYYALFSWKKAPILKQSYTNYKDNGVTALLGVVLFLLLIESSIIHLLLIRWNETVAWIVFLTSFYAALQIFGHLKALKQRTSHINGNQLFLKYGLFGDMKVDIHHINRIEFSSDNVIDETLVVAKLALFKELESHNVVIYFSEKQRLETAYGITKACDTLLLYVDNKQELKNAIEDALQHNR